MPETLPDERATDGQATDGQATDGQATDGQATYGFIRAVLPRWTEVPGLGRWRIDAPRVRDALPCLASAPGLIRGETQDTEVFWETVEGWLPADLVEVLRLLKTVDVLKTVYGIIAEGAPEMPKAGEGEEQKTRRLDAVDWDGLLADYMHAYRVTAQQVLEEPWNAFLLLSLKARRVLAREQWRLYTVQALLNIQEKRTRQDLFRRLMEDAEFEHGSENLSRDERQAQQKANLAALDGFFGALKSNPSA